MLEERNRRTRTRKEITGGSREEYKRVTAREPGWVSEQWRRGSGSRWVERRPKDELLASFAPTGGGGNRGKESRALPRRGRGAPSMEEFKVSEVERFQGQVRGVALRPNT